VIEFEGHFVPDDSKKLTAFLRDEAKRAMVEDRNPNADQSSLDWVQRFVAAYPEMEAAVEDAYEKLLTQAEPRVFSEVLFQIEHRPGAMPGRLPRVLVKAQEPLSGAEDPTRDGRTLLGALVEALARFRPSLEADAIDTLASIQRPQDGWPTAFRLALTADPGRFAARVNETIEALGDEELSLFLASVLNDGGDASSRVIDAIAKAPPALRHRVGLSIKTFLEQSEADRQHMIASGILERYPEEIKRRVTQPREDKWPSIASQLGVPVDLKA
jgi:hypothetical protein